MAGALLFTALTFGALGFALGWWVRDVTYRTEDALEAGGKKKDRADDGA